MSDDTRVSDHVSGEQASTGAETDTRLAGARERPCANHPARLTMVACSACGKPLCPDCMVYSAVGIKCWDCAKMPRSARVTLRHGRMLRSVVVGVGVGTAVGFAYYYVLGAGRFFFFLFFVAAGIGYLVGEAVRRASGYYRGLTTAVVAAVSTVWAFVLPPVVSTFWSTGFGWDAVVFSLSSRGVINWVVMAVAAYLAWARNR